MKRIELSSKISAPNFIGAWEDDNPEPYEGIINYFDTNKKLQTSGTVSGEVKREQKLSIDVTVDPDSLCLETHKPMASYIELLSRLYGHYVETWPFLKGFGELEIGSFNIQMYDEGGHFSRLHCERGGEATSSRVFAWMSYLNNVESGGNTVFPHYGINIPPRRGKTLIWPAEWTHAHYGAKVDKGVKYIITGWMDFPSS